MYPTQPSTVTSNRTSATGSWTSSRPERAPSWLPPTSRRVVSVCIFPIPILATSTGRAPARIAFSPSRGDFQHISAVLYSLCLGALLIARICLTSVSLRSGRVESWIRVVAQAVSVTDCYATVVVLHLCLFSLHGTSVEPASLGFSSSCLQDSPRPKDPGEQPWTVFPANTSANG